MTRTIPAHIEDGRVIPDTPLPEEIRSVSIVVETAESPRETEAGSDRSRPAGRLPAKPQRTQAERRAAMDRLIGILKDCEPPEDDREEYRRYLEEKYG